MNDSTQNRGAVFDLLRSEEVGSRLLNLSHGQTVFQPDEPAADLFLIETGEIRLFQTFVGGEQSLLDILGTGELFGLSALGCLLVYGKLATSVGDSKARAVPTDLLRIALLAHGDLAVQFIEILAQQLHNVWTEGNKFFLEDCRFRLIRKLIAFADSPAAQPVSGGVELRVTQAQLAQAIGAARETVTNCLMELRKENLIQTRRNRVIYNPDCLRRLYPDPTPTRELAIAV